MLIKFLIITETEARDLAYKEDVVYTPFFDEDNIFYIYKDIYDPSDLNTIELEIDYEGGGNGGLTPINPGKPMFPRKP